MPSEHIVVLGGTSGIGLATARLLLERGKRVTVTGRDPQRVEAMRGLGANVDAVVLDAADGGAVQGFFARIGRFEHLVLAFGSRRGVGPFGSTDLADVRLGFEEKVFPHMACAQAALPHLADNGSLTFVSAVSGQASMPGTAGIGAANAAVAALVPILAKELKPRRVNGVSPGVIDTPWWDFLPEQHKKAAFEDFAGQTPVGRIGRSEDVADAIAFLIGNTFMDGHLLICDGGAHLAG